MSASIDPNVGNATYFQQILAQERTLIYSADSVGLGLQLSLAITYLFLAYRGITKYSANTFNLSVLIANGTAMFLYSLNVAWLMVGDQRLIEA